jgi:hypothetical protein
MRVVTFQVRGHERSVSDSLAGLGFLFGPSVAVTTTVIDTFDGRLHRAGLRLRVDKSDADTMVAIGQLTGRLDQQRLAARAEFAERFGHYDTPATQRALDAVLAGITE